MTLRELFWATHGEGGYEAWLEDEVKWYRQWADDLATSLADLASGNAKCATCDEATIEVLRRYRDERNVKDFDS